METPRDRVRPHRRRGGAESAQGADHGGDVALAAQLADEASARLEGAEDAAADGRKIAHPMQGGIAEHRVELARERQSLRP